MEEAFLVKIPDVFRRAQRAVFQDKAVEHYKAVKQTGTLGSETVKPAETPAGSFTVNFRLVTYAMQAQEWGLQCNKDATFSTTDTLAVEKGDYVKYGGAYYRITEIQPHDSHTLYLCKAVSR